MPQSTWSPAMSSLPPQLHKLILDDLNHFDYPKNKTNLTKDETVALKQLTKNHNIVIKPADKGSSDPSTCGRGIDSWRTKIIMLN